MCRSGFDLRGGALALALAWLAGAFAHAGELSEPAYAPTPFRGVHGMAWAPDGALLVADTYRHFNPERSALYRWREGSTPEPVFRGQEIAGVSRAGEGYLICDFGAGRVYRTGASFEVLETWAVEKPWNARRAPDGTFYAVTYTTFFRLGAAGAVEQLISALDYPFDLAFPARGPGVWITEQGKEQGAVSLWAPDAAGQWRRILSSDHPWSNPEGILATAQGLFAVDTQTGDVVRMDERGRSARIAAGIGLPILILPDGEQRLLIFANRTPSGPALVRVAIPPRR